MTALRIITNSNIYMAHLYKLVNRQLSIVGHVRYITCLLADDMEYS